MQQQFYQPPQQQYITVEYMNKQIEKSRIFAFWICAGLLVGAFWGVRPAREIYNVSSWCILSALSFLIWPISNVHDTGGEIVI